MKKTMEKLMEKLFVDDKNQVRDQNDPQVRNVLIGVKIPCNKGGHYPFCKSQLDSRTFGVAGPIVLWTHYDSM
jgi:hypothetical protein